MATPVSEALGRYLSLSSQQLALTAANMANIDTPGYRTQGIDFESEMRHALTAGEGGPARVMAVNGLLERPDGNNVSMDRESLLMAQTQLQFRTGVELLKREFTRLSDAIHEDK